MRCVWADILTLTFRQAKLRVLLVQIIGSGDQSVAERPPGDFSGQPVAAA